MFINFGDSDAVSAISLRRFTSFTVFLGIALHKTCAQEKRQIAGHLQKVTGHTGRLQVAPRNCPRRYHNVTLRELSLGANAIGREGDRAFSDALRENPHLRHCRVWLDGDATDEGVGRAESLCGALLFGRVGALCNRTVVCVPQPCDRM